MGPRLSEFDLGSQEVTADSEVKENNSPVTEEEAPRIIELKKSIDLPRLAREGMCRPHLD
jgi:hypothetical protein